MNGTAWPCQVFVSQLTQLTQHNPTAFWASAWGCPTDVRRPRLSSNSGHGSIYHEVQKIASTSHSSPERSERSQQRNKTTCCAMIDEGRLFQEKQTHTQGIWTDMCWLVVPNLHFFPPQFRKHKQYSPLGILGGVWREGKRGSGHNIVAKLAPPLL